MDEMERLEAQRNIETVLMHFATYPVHPEIDAQVEYILDCGEKVIQDPWWRPEMYRRMRMIRLQAYRNMSAIQRMTLGL